MSEASHDERIRARIEAAADTMPDAPVRWERVASLARRKLLISVVAALALAALAAVLLAYAGSYSSLKLTGTAPIALPGLAHKQLSTDRTRPSWGSASQPTDTVTSGTANRYSSVAKGSHAKGQGTGDTEPKEIRLSLSAASVPANGTSTVTVTARVLNAIGRPLSGQDVKFFSSDPIAERAIPVRGVYVVTITSSTTAGPVTVEARDGALLARDVFQQTAVEPNSGCSNKEGEAGTTTTESTIPTTGTTTTTTSTGSTVGSSPATAGTTPCGTSTKVTTNGVSTNGTSASGSGTATQGTTTGTNTHETDTTKAGAGRSRQSPAENESGEVG